MLTCLDRPLSAGYGLKMPYKGGNIKSIRSNLERSWINRANHDNYGKILPVKNFATIPTIGHPILESVGERENRSAFQHTLIDHKRTWCPIAMIVANPGILHWTVENLQIGYSFHFNTVYIIGIFNVIAFHISLKSEYFHFPRNCSNMEHHKICLYNQIYFQ